VVQLVQILQDSEKNGLRINQPLPQSKGRRGLPARLSIHAHPSGRPKKPLVKKDHRTVKPKIHSENQWPANQTKCMGPQRNNLASVKKKAIKEAAQSHPHKKQEKKGGRLKPKKNSRNKLDT